MFQKFLSGFLIHTGVTKDDLELPFMSVVVNNMSKNHILQRSFIT